MSLIKNSAIIGGFTLISRVLALFRDTLMARFVGAGFASDAFLIAWRLPNLFRSLFAEGAFASAFVPMFNRSMSAAELDGEDGLTAAVNFASHVLSFLFPILLIFTLTMILFSSQVVWVMTGGFPDGGREKFELATNLTQITFPYLGLISLVSLLGGILNSVNRFWVNAAAPIVLNVCMIASILFFRGNDPVETARSQAIAVTASGVMQLIWLIWSCRSAGVTLRFHIPRLTPDVKRMLIIILPAALGAGAQQFNLFISSSLAARFLAQGSISYLYYADRLYQLPLGLIGIGVGTAILPLLSRQIASGHDENAAHTQNRAIELSLILALPATVALIVSSVPITRALFQSGAFKEADTIGSAAALSAYSWGIPAYILIKVLTPGFYARQDTRTPVRIALISVGLNLIGNIVLIWPLRHVGVAISTAIAAWANVIMLYFTLRRMGHFKIDKNLKDNFIKSAFSCVILGFCLVILNPLVDNHLSHGLVERALWLSVLCLGGGATYLLACIATGIFPWSLLRLKRRKAI